MAVVNAYKYNPPSIGTEKLAEFDAASTRDCNSEKHAGAE